MKKYVIRAFGIVAGLTALTPVASAHFALNYPPVAVAQGTGLGNEQKTGPCPTGTATNAVTELKAGETIKVKFTETIAHDGHFRYSIGNPASMTTPMVTGNNCAMAAIEAVPKLPTILDGVKHTGRAGMMWEQDVTIPKDFTCEKCSFQVIQFMTAHGAPCFYYRCATVTVTASAGPTDAGAADAKSDAVTTIDMSGGSGGVPGSGGVSGAAGAGGGGSGAGGTTTGSGGTTVSTGGISGGSSGGTSGTARGGSTGTSSGGSSGTTPAGGGSSGGGCAVGTGGATGAGFLGALLGLVLAARRRRR